MKFSIEDLKKLPVWVNWKYQERDGEKTKIPINSQTGGRAQSNNSETWTNFDFAQNKAIGYSGVGFMFANGICGIDIDNKTNNLELGSQAEAVINLMDTYTETSPSGTGFHIIFKCDLSRIPSVKGKLNEKYYQKNPHNGLECYFSGLTNRYFTFTDKGNKKPIEDRTEQVLIFLESYMLRDNFKKKAAPMENDEYLQGLEMSPPLTKENLRHSDLPPTIDILDKIRQSKQGTKFSALFDRGDISAYNNDDSAADIALCNILAFWLQGDFGEIDRHLRQSALYRDKWERHDYRTATIKKAVDLCGGEYYKPPGRPKNEKPRREYTATERETIKKAVQDYGIFDEEKITIAGVALYLDQKGIKAKYNVITKKIDVAGLETYGENATESLPTLTYNDLNLRYKRCSESVIQSYIKVITMQNTYNPVLNLIEGATWDKNDRLPGFFNIMQIDENDKLSKILFVKWFWQNLSLLRNDRGKYGADGVLVLQGEQGIGKTSFAKKTALKDEFFREGIVLDVRNKDSIIRAVSCWIGELGEIESTFKSDINALKSFITQATDTYRVPYGRVEGDYPRRTSFIGTCNSDEFLIDETGNRRFWTVPIGDINLDALGNFDMLQLYKQIDERAKNNPQGFRLTAEENKMLAERNSHHEKPMKAESEIRDILFEAERDNLSYELMTATEFKILYQGLKNYSANQIGAALNQIGINPDRKTKDGEKQRLRLLPRPKNTIRIDPSDFNSKL